MKCPVCNSENLSPETMINGESTGILGTIYFNNKVTNKKVTVCIRSCRICRDCNYVLTFIRDKNGEFRELKEKWNDYEGWGLDYSQNIK